MAMKYAGAKRDDAPPSFWIGTSEVQRYLQDRLDMIVAVLRKKDKNYEGLRNITVRIGASQASAKYCPMMVLLTPNALEINASNANAELSHIYQQKDEEAELQLIPEIQNFFKLYAYNKKDKQSFSDPRYLRELGISRQTATKIKQFCSPRYIDNGRGENTVEQVMFFIDPVRVFHDMFSDDDPKSRNNDFRVTIDRFKKINTAEFKYHVIKTKKNGKKKGANFMKDIDEFLRTRNG